MAFHGVDPGDDALGLCIICGEYIFDSEVEFGEAFLEPGSQLPEHHNVCLQDFVATGKLDPGRIKYYTDLLGYFLDPMAEYFTTPAAYLEASEHISYAEVAGAIQNVAAKVKRMSLEEAKVFLRERAKHFKPKDKLEEYALSLVLSGISAIPVFPCRYAFRKEMLFPKYNWRGFVRSSLEKNIISVMKEQQEELRYIILLPSKKIDISEITKEDLCDYGVLARLTIESERPDADYEVTIVALRRVTVSWENDSSAFFAKVVPVEERADCDVNEEGVKAKIERLAMIVNAATPEVFSGEAVGEWYHRWDMIREGRFGELLDTFAAYAGKIYEEELFECRYAVLQSASFAERLDKALELGEVLNHFMEKARQSTAKSVQEAADAQRKAGLQIELQTILRELGEERKDITRWEKRLQELEALNPSLPQEVIAEGRSQLELVRQYKPEDSSYAKVGTWMKRFLYKVPWDRKTQDRFDLKIAREIFDEDHYTLDHVKDRMIEYVALLKRQTESKLDVGEIGKKKTVICLVGPRGVGKTSFAISIARALGRKHFITSLGGVNDVAAINGFDETYQTSMPGRIMHGYTQVGVNNPVFIVEEIDKTTQQHGDPQSALLAVFDSTLYGGFVDSYFRVPFDVSDTLFITTANYLGNMLPALVDRMEEIQIPGYIASEKLGIARRHFIPQELRYHVLSPKQVEIPDATVLAMLDWTSELGVRKLREKVARVCRQIIVENPTGKVIITPEMLLRYLGPKTKYDQPKPILSRPGVAVGLAVTSEGEGVLQFVEVKRHSVESGVKFEKQILATGKIKEVMRESLLVALERVWELSEDKQNPYYISRDVLNAVELHLHAAPLSVEKDGPSATVTVFAAFVSALLGVRLNPDVTMTGEMNQGGMVLPVGGLLQKFFVAHVKGLRKMLYPWQQQEEAKDILAKYPDLESSTVYVPVHNDQEVLQHALLTSFAQAGV